MTTDKFPVFVGADPNVADSSNNTAIHYAAAYGWYHCVNVLLQATANPDVYNDRKVGILLTVSLDAVGKSKVIV